MSRDVSSTNRMRYRGPLVWHRGAKGDFSLSHSVYILGAFHLAAFSMGNYMCFGSFVAKIGQMTTAIIYSSYNRLIGCPEVASN